MRSLRIVLVVFLIVATSSCRWVVRASVDSAGNQANDDSYGVVLSADARFVAFDSDASNLVPNDTNGDRDVFVRDNRTGAVERVLDSAALVDISEDGRYVAVSDFASCRDLGYQYALFIFDRQNDVTECIYPAGSGIALSATFRVVAFSSGSNVWVFDRDTGQTEVIPVPSVPDGYLLATHVTISDDGRHVAFETSKQSTLCSPFPLDPCPPPLAPADVYVHDRQTGTNERIPLPPPEQMTTTEYGPGQAVYSSNASISGDGRWVAYQVGSMSEFDPTSCCMRSAWIYDRQTGVAEPVSVFPDGTLAQTHDPDNGPHISDDGRFVVFVSSERLDPDEPLFLGGTGLYVRDLIESRTTLLNRNVFGVPAPEQMFGHTLADNGRYVAFTSLSTNLVGNDTNSVSDVFLRAIPTPRVESVTPPSVPRGTSAMLTIVGDGFVPAPTAGVSGPTAGVSGKGVAVTAVTRVSEHELSVAVTVDELAPTGARTVFVKNTGTGPGPAAGDTGWCVSCLTVT